jgi:hypothetical protein
MSGWWSSLELKLKGVLAFFAVVAIVTVVTAGSLVSSGEMSSSEFMLYSLLIVSIISAMVFVLTLSGKINVMMKQLETPS